MPEFRTLRKRYPRIDAADKVTGKSVFAGDITLPGMLYGKILRSPHANAGILHIDTSKALELDGVCAVITANDAPGLKKNDSSLNPMLPLLARERVVYAGQPVAVVAATNPYRAKAALDAIKVDYEIRTPVIDVMEALESGAPLVHPDLQILTKPGPETPSNVFSRVVKERGDLEAGFKKADIVVANTYRTDRVHQGYLEPRAAVADVGPNGTITIWADNQGIFMAREFIAEFLEMPLSRIKVIPVEIGGAFGGKEPQLISPLCALLALKTGRPVKIVMSREEIFKDTRPAPPSVITVKIGAAKDGRITAASAVMVFDYGSTYGVHGLPEVPYAVFSALGAYNIPNLKIECLSVVTHKAPSGPYRSPTAPQGAFAVESQIDILSRKLGMDPIDLRLLNAVKEGDVSLQDDKPFAAIGFKAVLETMKAHLTRKGAVTGPWRGRGIGCGFWAPVSGPAAANVCLNADGSLIITVGSVDISGCRTGLAQIGAEAMELPFEKVTITTADTDTAPFSIPSVGSATTRSSGAAVFNACEDLKGQLCRKAAEKLGVSPENVEYTDGCLQVKATPEKSVRAAELVGEVVHCWAGVPMIGHGVIGIQDETPVCTCQAADIEIDPETGKVAVLSYITVQDLGVGVNPTLVEGQMQGAAVQGMGWAFNEGYVFNRDGILQNASLLDYRMPTALDVPFIDAMIVEVPSTSAPYNIRGAGEAPFVACLGTLANAVHDATGVRLTRVPMNPEGIFKSITT